MLLGIGLHAALSFYPTVWPVADSTADLDGYFDEFVLAMRYTFVGTMLNGKRTRPGSSAWAVTESSCRRHGARPCSRPTAASPAVAHMDEENDRCDERRPSAPRQCWPWRWPPEVRWHRTICRATT
jgi:hypothetical protein